MDDDERIFWMLTFIASILAQKTEPEKIATRAVIGVRKAENYFNIPDEEGFDDDVPL